MDALRPYRKFIAALVGALVILVEQLVTDTQAAALIVSLVTAVSVYLVPNDDSTVIS